MSNDKLLSDKMLNKQQIVKRQNVEQWNVEIKIVHRHENIDIPKRS
jgi:hypothetical protein